MEIPRSISEFCPYFIQHFSNPDLFVLKASYHKTRYGGHVDFKLSSGVFPTKEIDCFVIYTELKNNSQPYLVVRLKKTQTEIMNVFDTNAANASALLF